MLSKLRRYFTYANILATLAVIFAMGGTAYAVATIGSEEVVDESLQGVDVKNESLTRDDIANNTLNHAKILNGSVFGVDLASGSVNSVKVVDDTLTGADIVESSLGKVGDAETVDGKSAGELGVRAYGRVTPNCAQGAYPQQCGAQDAKNVSNVFRMSPGTYCIVVPGVDTDEIPLVATVDRMSTAGTEGNTDVMTDEGVNCGWGEFRLVTTRQSSIKVSTPGGGTAWALGSAAAANDVGFTFIVP